MFQTAAVIGVVGGFAGLVGGLSWLRRSGRLHPEVARKLLHVGMGLTCLTFPWLFPDPRAFAVAFGIVVAVLLGLRIAQSQGASAGAALHDVARRSYGELCFAAAVAGLYAFGRDDPVLYVAPLAVLTVADALAALSGVFYGKARFTAGGGAHKTWEGTAVFFLTAFVVLHVSILLLTDVDEASSLSIALALALLATATEAASWDGLDNFFLPLVIAIHLYGFLNMGPLAWEPFTALQANVIMVSLIGLAVAFARFKGLRTDALMAMIVFGYTFQSTGELGLFLAGLAVVFGWMIARRARPAIARTPPTAAVVAGACAPAALALFLSFHFDMLDARLTGAGVFAAALGVLWGETLLHGHPKAARLVLDGVRVGVLAGLFVAAGPALVSALEPEFMRQGGRIIAFAILMGAMGGVVGAVRRGRAAPWSRPLHHLGVGVAAVGVGFAVAASA